MEIFKDMCSQRGVSSNMVSEVSKKNTDRYYSKGFERTSQIEGKGIGK